MATALVAGGVNFATGNPIPGETSLQKRCGFMGTCTQHQTADTNTGKDTTTDNRNGVSTKTSYTDNSNAQTEGNNGGGGLNGAITMGGVCSHRQNLKRDLYHSLHVKRANHPDHRHHPHHAHQPLNKGPPIQPGADLAAQIRAQVALKTSSTSITSSNMRANSGNTNAVVKSKQANNLNMDGMSGNGGVNGVMCRRALDEVEVEKRELDRGGSVLAAIGGRTTDPSFESPTTFLATRDLGRLAESLGVRAIGHDESLPHFRRDVGIECASSDSCDELAKREAHEVLVGHARTLGFEV